jgi:sporulation protein YlmC with PRC-barrel domain
MDTTGTGFMEINNENALANSTGKNDTGKSANRPVRILTARSIIGDKVSNHFGEDLGTIEDIMLNIDEGTIEYVIIAFGGFMTMNQKYFAVPFKALSVDGKKHAFLLDQSREAFEKDPGFDKNHWPDANFHAPSSGSYGGFMGANTGSDH